jgi:hypothetical protein
MNGKVHFCAFDRPLVLGIIALLCLFGRTTLATDAPLTPAQAAIKQDRQHSERLRAYLAKKFPDEITAVSADADRIRIEGRLGAEKNPVDLRLAEVPMWEDITALKSPETLLAIDANEQGRFVVSVDRHAAGDRDRLLSAWCVVQKSGDELLPLSGLHYVDSERARADLPAAKPRSIKGLGGCPFDSPDMQQLGIASVTLNIVLNDIIYAEFAPGRSAYANAGHTWYIADKNVANYDRYMRTAADHGWMVSAIILLQPVRNAPKNAWVRDAAHPDADPSGIYVMPNFTTRAGVEAYAAVMNFLAERYSRPDGKFGRIHDWILHNEINSGFYWTTAGDKSLITYLDLYQKSLRLTLLLARQYDPHAKPLISLDHYWSKNADARGYPARELLDQLVNFSRKEGDFEWGIAFHPYAQDLFNPRTWEDREVTFDFNTPLITFKNIEVLDAWVRQPRVCFRGQEPREIQLTEQGLNSRDYSEAALRDQAAGLAYAWKKIKPLKTITAFQYHLWADNRGEGGLRLGLRKFADDPQDPLGKKPSWAVYRALDTDQEEAATAFAKPIVGVKEWSEILQRRDIK